MENSTSPQKNSPTPRETFERALELVRNQTMMREDIMNDVVSHTKFHYFYEI